MRECLCFELCLSDQTSEWQRNAIPCSLSAAALDLIPSPTSKEGLCAKATSLLDSKTYGLQEGASAAIIIAKLR